MFCSYKRFTTGSKSPLTPMKTCFRLLVAMSFMLLYPVLPLAADGNNYGAVSSLQQGVGARANGLGDAFVGVADDATAGYWNPAGLSQMERYSSEAGAQYAFLPNDMRSSYLTYAFQWPDVGAFSLGWANFTVANLEGRDAQGRLTNSFSSGENAFHLSFGRRVYEWVKGLSLGANLKLLYQGIGDYSGRGPGLDLGMLWQPIPAWDHTLGLTVQNLFQQVSWSSGAADPSLVTGRLGLALRFLPSGDRLYSHLINAVDFEFSEYQRFNLHLGSEYWFWDSLAVRTGWSGTHVALGASYRPEYYQIDYAFIYDTSVLAAHQHRLTVQLRLPPQAERPPGAAGGPDSQAEPAVAPETAIPEPAAAYSPGDLEPQPEGPVKKIPADIVEIQRTGGRVSNVILNVGSDQQIEYGFKGAILDATGRPIAALIIREVDPKLSLAEVVGLGRDIGKKAKAVIDKPLAK